MRRASITLAGRRAATRAGGAASFAEVDLRAAKQAHVAGARESVFGPQGSMPGDRYFRKKLEGRKLMRWYFPSKYNFQDFRIDEYFEMQAERFEERPAHPSIGALQTLLNDVSRQRKNLKDFFGRVDEETFLRNPSLQDLYGALRFVEPDAALSFLPPKPSLDMVTEAVFQDHLPLTGPSPPFRIEGEAQPGEAAEEEFDEGLMSLYLAVKAAVSQDKLLDLEVQFSKATGAADLRERLEVEASKLGLVPQLDSFTPVFKESDATVQRRAFAEAQVMEAKAAEDAAKKARAEAEERAVAEALEARAAAAAEGRLLGKWSWDERRGPGTILRSEDGSLRMRFSPRKGREVEGVLERHGAADEAVWRATMRLVPKEAASEAVAEAAAWGDVELRLLEASEEPGSEKRQNQALEVKANIQGEWFTDKAELREAPSEAEAEREAKRAEAAAAAASKRVLEAVEKELAKHTPVLRPPVATRRQLQQRLELFRVRTDFGISQSQQKKEAEDGRRELRRLGVGGQASVQKYLARRHRFVDPMFRRRRLKWLERQMAGKNNAKEVKYNSYYATHPDDHSEWPTNKGSVTVTFPSPYH